MGEEQGQCWLFPGPQPSSPYTHQLHVTVAVTAELWRWPPALLRGGPHGLRDKSGQSPRPAPWQCPLLPIPAPAVLPAPNPPPQQIRLKLVPYSQFLIPGSFSKVNLDPIKTSS